MQRYSYVPGVLNIIGIRVPLGIAWVLNESSSAFIQCRAFSLRSMLYQMTWVPAGMVSTFGSTPVSLIRISFGCRVNWIPCTRLFVTGVLAVGLLTDVVLSVSEPQAVRAITLDSVKIVRTVTRRSFFMPPC